MERSIRLKMKKAAKEQQEELALDMKILEQLLEESRNEAKEQTDRKLRDREENQRYRNYLKDMVSAGFSVLRRDVLMLLRKNIIL